jgi:hypothetical protein
MAPAAQLAVYRVPAGQGLLEGEEQGSVTYLPGCSRMFFGQHV